MSDVSDEDSLKALSADLDDVVARAEAMGVGVMLEGDVFDGVATIHMPDIGRDRSDASTRGNGAIVIGEVCAVADRHGATLELEHMADEPGLSHYYERFGLMPHPTQDGNPDLVSLRREPRKIVIVQAASINATEPATTRGSQPGTSRMPHGHGAGR